MRLRGLIPVLLLLAGCERSVPAPEGAYGYWAGYGATEYSVTIQ